MIGQPLDLPAIAGRRRSKLITPVPRSKKKGKKAEQASLLLPDAHDLSTEDQEYNPTPIINEIRNYVEAWRSLPNPAQWGVTPTTARLLQHRRHHEFTDQRPFFCQIEAIETAVWLTEVARGQRRYASISAHIKGANEQSNPDLLRIALKMATGSGKTTVMAMLIAWQTLNAVRSPNSSLFSRGFLIVTPGITIKDRLRVLQTNDADSYYRNRELVPADMLADLDKAKIVITNYHSFKLRETLDVSKVGRSLLQGRGEAPIPAPAAPVALVDAFAHPDAQRRFRVVENEEELARALDAPWERWIVFLHPTQRGVVERSFNGPARVTGSAGTGKTVVALHRAARLARASTAAQILLTTFSQPLASALERRVLALAGGPSGIVPRITVAPFQKVADDLYQLGFGRRATPASEAHVQEAVRQASEAAGDTGYPLRFLLSEWRHVVDAWQIDSLEAYARVPRLGRKNRMSAGQRERLWPVFAEVRASLAKRGVLTWSEIFAQAAAHYASRADKPFSHIIVDEAQDLGVPELRLMAAIAPKGADALFFAGDLGQRIFQQPFSWQELGVDIRGRSSTLTVNYRTSHQIRRAADRLLPRTMRDVDGVGDERERTVSIFNGPDPETALYASKDDEVAGVASWIERVLKAGTAPAEIGVFVRSQGEMDRARRAVRSVGQEALELSESDEATGLRIPIGTMHLAKGLEFKAVAVMGCDDDVLPLCSRIETVADEVELDEVYETERHLFYVACTRARDQLRVTAVSPGSEFLDDLQRS